jgi:hypothetical protein
VHDVTSGETLVGRDRECEVNPERKRRLPRSELRVSRKHARIRETAQGEHEVEDLGSRYGTTVNGERCEDGRAVTIRDKDVVVFGGMRRYIYLRFSDDGAAQATEVDLSDRMRDEMQCVVCSDTYRAPITLQCGHSFCAPCIATWVMGGPARGCPTCKAEIGPGRPRVNVVLQALSSLLHPADLDRRAIVSALNAEPRQAYEERA